MLAKLNDLKSSDPEKFQSTMKDMSDHLREAAKEQGGNAAQFLNGMADKVAEAAKTGDLSALKPPSGGFGPPGGRAGSPPPGMRGHVGGPPPGGAPSGAGGAHAGTSSTGKSSSNVITDPADANGDGTVSAAEKQAYSVKHPKAAESSQTKAG